MTHDCSLHSVLHRLLQRLVGMVKKKKGAEQITLDCSLVSLEMRNWGARNLQHNCSLQQVWRPDTSPCQSSTDRRLSKRHAAPLGLLGSLLSD